MSDGKLGSARVSLRFERTSEGIAAVTVQATEGELDVVVEPAAGLGP